MAHGMQYSHTVLTRTIFQKKKTSLVGFVTVPLYYGSHGMQYSGTVINPTKLF